MLSDDDIPGSHRRALAQRRLALGRRGDPALVEELKLLGLPPEYRQRVFVDEVDWARLIHLSGLGRQVKVERDVYSGFGSYVACCRLVGGRRRVALKILHPALWEDEVLAQRFEREGELLSGLAHQNVVRLVARGVYGYARWLMLEWIEGGDLRALASRGKRRLAQAIDIVVQLCAGLEHLHAAGIVHRDIKPENVMCERWTRRVVVTDFGIAKVRDRKLGDLTLTSTEDVMGTMGYIAPEQTVSSKQVDHRADIYAAGMVLLELLTGEVAEESYRQTWSPPAVAPEVDEVIRVATARDPEHRFESAAAMAAQLEAVRPRGLLARVFGGR